MRFKYFYPSIEVGFKITSDLLDGINIKLKVIDSQ